MAPRERSYQEDMAKSEDLFCGGYVKLNIAVLFAGITDMVVAVSYLVSIASAYTKTSTERPSVPELTIRCFVPIVSLAAVFFLSLGIMTRLPWLLIFHLAKSVILASTLGLKSILDILDMVRQHHFELYAGTGTIFMAMYAMSEIWFFFVVRKAYINMVRVEDRESRGDGSSVFEEMILSKPSATSSQFRQEQDRLNRILLAKLSATSKSHPNCYYEIPIHQMPMAIQPKERKEAVYEEAHGDCDQLNGVSDGRVVRT